MAIIGRGLPPALAEPTRDEAGPDTAAGSAAAGSAVPGSAVPGSAVPGSAAPGSAVAGSAGDPSLGLAGPVVPPPIPAATLAAYRDAVEGLIPEIADEAGPDGAVKAAGALDDQLVRPKLAAVLSRVPGGPAAVAANLLREIWNFEPDTHGPAGDLAAVLRVHLRSQIDVAWWAGVTPYLTHADLRDSADLVRLDSLRRGALRFRYRRAPSGLPGRAVHSAQRRVWPHRVPHTAGMRFPYARPEAVAWLNLLAVEFRAACGDAAAPPLWVNSLARSVEQQRQLRGSGLPAVLPSAHCVGYAMDLEMSWLRRYNAHEVLQRLLSAHQAAGDVNVIDEGPAWHVCLAPHTVQRLRRDAAPTPPG